MALVYLKDTGTAQLTVTDLVRFAYPKEHPERLTKQYGFQRDEIYEGYDNSDAPEISPTDAGIAAHHVYETDSVTCGSPDTAILANVTRERPLELDTVYQGMAVTVSGRADIVAFDGETFTVEEIKTMAYLPYSMTPFHDPAHFAQAACYGYLLASAEGAESVRLRITFLKRNGGDRISYAARFPLAFLKNLFDGLMERAGPFLLLAKERAEALPEEIVACPFPYKNIREGQREFILEAFRTVKSGGNLFVSAPTGIGKTMASVYPALKGIGAGVAEKAFYLTSKTVTGLAALDAARVLSEKIPHLRAMMVTAKEAQCLHRAEKEKDPVGQSCEYCANRGDCYTENGAFLSYPERENDALLSLLYSEDRIYTTERIKSTAKTYSVCPYELSLDLSMYCELVVCDYNYAYDDSVRFQRYFKTPEISKKYVFLIDEAHNLPDRVRDMYSASLSSSLVEELLHICRGGQGEVPELFAALTQAKELLDTIRGLCREGEYTKTENGQEIPCGYYRTDESNLLMEKFSAVFTKLSAVMNRHIRGMGDYAGELYPFRNLLRKLAFVCTVFDRRFCLFAERTGEEVTVDLLCLDPSDIIRRMNRTAKAVIQFSATLSPMEYYKTVSGCPRAVELDLDSPYDKENLCLVAFDSISTRFTDRRDTAYDTAYVIAEAIAAREGNYMVYFSSYAHMKTVVKHFSALASQMLPEVTLVMQKSGMSFRERERFLSVFGDSRYSNVVGFCVLGGMFSEGIDLTGEKLIGAIIIGTGLPGLSAQRNIMMEYYDNTMEKGREFAYVYPGMNKVLQAAGRVIRSENDRGMVLLIDDRYGEPATRLLFPAHWRHLRYTGDVDSLRYILDEFWEKAGD